MRFSLDLINFSGADLLHMFFLAVLVAVLIRIKAVLITLSVVATYGSQAYHKASIEAERVNV